ncbi:hypothetical protein D9756_005343 [Leucocoprinus leucothites]|uniref:Succinate dehydrogenase assembly factor 4, mitochondrial n=1 Tax=Leucocoprinus leucothites TaxID=201217 RepID=A0A8H5D7R6_9AGAR|nr:hypothetical protein D9756_005343 [Leucoagaricus leucothites]
MSSILCTRTHRYFAQRLYVHSRTMANLNRPAPPPLPREQQREFEELLRKAQTPLAQSSSSVSPELHPDAREPIQPEFEGEQNPITGERGGPKREPIGRWAEDGGDWSFKGRVSDF